MFVPLLVTKVSLQAQSNFAAHYLGLTVFTLYSHGFDVYFQVGEETFWHVAIVVESNPSASD